MGWISIVGAIVVSFFVGVGCYQWGYNKARESEQKFNNEQITELKKEHRKQIAELYNKINKREQD